MFSQVEGFINKRKKLLELLSNWIDKIFIIRFCSISILIKAKS